MSSPPIGKIRKLLRLARNAEGTPEGDRAQERAEDLMRLHRVEVEPEDDVVHEVVDHQAGHFREQIAFAAAVVRGATSSLGPKGEIDLRGEREDVLHAKRTYQNILKIASCEAKNAPPPVFEKPSVNPPSYFDLVIYPDDNLASTPGREPKFVYNLESQAKKIHAEAWRVYFLLGFSNKALEIAKKAMKPKKSKKKKKPVTQGAPQGTLPEKAENAEKKAIGILQKLADAFQAEGFTKREAEMMANNFGDKAWNAGKNKMESLAPVLLYRRRETKKIVLALPPARIESLTLEEKRFAFLNFG